MKIGIFSGNTIVRSKDSFTDNSRYPTEKHEIIRYNFSGGIITSDDLEMYQAVVKNALTIDLSSGYTVMSAPPPSSGGIVLLILNILDGKLHKQIAVTQNFLRNPDPAIHFSSYEELEK